MTIFDQTKFKAFADNKFKAAKTTAVTKWALTETSVMHTNWHMDRHTDKLIPMYPENICFGGHNICWFSVFDRVENIEGQFFLIFSQCFQKPGGC